MSRARPVQSVGSYLSPYIRKVLVVLDLTFGTANPRRGVMHI
jgi:hypothetical protein